MYRPTRVRDIVVGLMIVLLSLVFTINVNVTCEAYDNIGAVDDFPDSVQRAEQRAGSLAPAP